MIRRVLGTLLAITLATAGLTAIAQTPALAAVGGCSTNNVTISACINFGDAGGNKVRADFYLNRAVDHSVNHFDLEIIINGHRYDLAYQNFDHQGRYCCWTKTWDNLPDTNNTAYTQMRVWTADAPSVLHMTVYSPTIRFKS
jgi:hypothetical protein